VTTLPVEPLEPNTFAPFGAVLDRPRRDADARGPGWSWWGENELLTPCGRGYGIGFLDLEPAAPEFDWAERHMASQELIAPLAGTCLVYVGPAAPPDRPDPDGFRVFRVDPGRAVILAPGVWHGAPLAVGGPARAIVLLKSGTGRDDTSVARFEEGPVKIRLGGDAHADR